MEKRYQMHHTCFVYGPFNSFYDVIKTDMMMCIAWIFPNVGSDMLVGTLPLVSHPGLTDVAIV